MIYQEILLICYFYNCLFLWLIELFLNWFLLLGVPDSPPCNGVTWELCCVEKSKLCQHYQIKYGTTTSSSIPGSTTPHSLIDWNSYKVLSHKLNILINQESRKNIFHQPFYFENDQFWLLIQTIFFYLNCSIPPFPYFWIHTIISNIKNLFFMGINQKCIFFYSND